MPPGPRTKRVELRFPDPSANPYLAFTAILMAGLDGIERKLEPGDAMDRNLYDLRPEEAEDLASVSRSLGEALDALAADHEFLTRGDVHAARPDPGLCRGEAPRVRPGRAHPAPDRVPALSGPVRIQLCG